METVRKQMKKQSSNKLNVLTAKEIELEKELVASLEAKYKMKENWTRF